MGGCYSTYASSRKLHGCLGNLSFVLPVTDRDAASAASGSDGGSSRKLQGGGKEVNDEQLVATRGAALGRGEFGVTRRCKDAVTGEALTCKTIRRHRRRGRTAHNHNKAGAAAAAFIAAAAAHAADVRREVAIMRRMSARGGAAVVRLREAREDADGAVHLVMELCEGGELFHRIVALLRQKS